MTHGDTRGLRLPPAVAPVQVVVIPIYKTDQERATVLEVAAKVKDTLAADRIRVRVDDRDQHRPGYKFSEWELKGVPVRLEIGPRDVQEDRVVVVTRSNGEKRAMSTDEAVAQVDSILEGEQRSLYEQADGFRTENSYEATAYDEIRDGLADKGGFWAAPWCGDVACEEKIKAETRATIRVLPIDQEDPGGACVVCGRPGTERATWAKSY
ncbi:MAG: hypothetical protein H0U16_05555 [Actinobacteria bacterium]|nr:hypothetical protein [Actinomycetota bacterium]